MTERSQTFRDDRSHVFHSWSAQGALNPVVVAGAQGSYFWDEDGNRFLDFSSQLVNVNIGHQHPKLVQAIKDAADRMCTMALLRRLVVQPRCANQPREMAQWCTFDRRHL